MGNLYHKKLVSVLPSLGNRLRLRSYIEGVLVMPVARMAELEGVLLIVVGVTGRTEVKELLMAELVITCVTTDV